VPGNGNSVLAICSVIDKKVGHFKCELRFAEYRTLSKIVKADAIAQSAWRKEVKRVTGIKSGG